MEIVTPKDILKPYTLSVFGKVNVVSEDNAIDAMEEYLSKMVDKKSHVNINIPEDADMVKLAIVFNDGGLDKEVLTNMVAYATCIIHRLKEHNSILLAAKNENE
jgi:hypothetical protein